MKNCFRLGIFGYPVGHSKSPAMHQAAANALGLSLEYDRFEVAPTDLQAAIAREQGEGIDGYNLTVPHKEAVIEWLDEVVPTAATIGAVNTVVRREGNYVGHNTDAPGLVQSLVEAGVEVEAARAIVLGAGGAARAAVVGLAQARAREIAVLARRPAQGQALVESLRGHLACPIESGSIEDASSHFESATLVIQATSATLGSTPASEAFAESLPIDALPQTAVVLDMVYKPLETAVLRRARARGLETIDGLGMLLHQGAIGFELWTGRTPPLEVMRATLSD